MQAVVSFAIFAVFFLVLVLGPLLREVAELTIVL